MHLPFTQSRGPKRLHTQAPTTCRFRSFPQNAEPGPANGTQKCALWTRRRRLGSGVPCRRRRRRTAFKGRQHRLRHGFLGHDCRQRLGDLCLRSCQVAQDAQCLLEVTANVLQTRVPRGSHDAADTPCQYLPMKIRLVPFLFPPRGPSQCLHCTRQARRCSRTPHATP